MNNKWNFNAFVQVLTKNCENSRGISRDNIAIELLALITDYHEEHRKDYENDFSAKAVFYKEEMSGIDTFDSIRKYLGKNTNQVPSKFFTALTPVQDNPENLIIDDLRINRLIRDIQPDETLLKKALINTIRSDSDYQRAGIKGETLSNLAGTIHEQPLAIALAYCLIDTVRYRNNVIKGGVIVEDSLSNDDKRLFNSALLENIRTYIEDFERYHLTSSDSDSSYFREKATFTISLDDLSVQSDYHTREDIIKQHYDDTRTSLALLKDWGFPIEEALSILFYNEYAFIEGGYDKIFYEFTDKYDIESLKPIVCSGAIHGNIRAVHELLWHLFEKGKQEELFDLTCYFTGISSIHNLINLSVIKQLLMDESKVKTLDEIYNTTALNMKTIDDLLNSGEV